MKNSEERWCTSEKYGDSSQLSPDWDKVFRQGIVDTLLAIGMPIDAIEEGIEKNADKWRSIKMESSFRNAYNPIFNYLEPIEARLKAPEPEFHDAWMKMRLYEYYQEHKESVDKYGEVLDEMKMTDEEVQKLKQYLEIKIQERLDEIKIADEKKLTRKK